MKTKGLLLMPIPGDSQGATTPLVMYGDDAGNLWVSLHGSPPVQWIGVPPAISQGGPGLVPGQALADSPPVEGGAIAASIGKLASTGAVVAPVSEQQSSAAPQAVDAGKQAPAAPKSLDPLQSQMLTEALSTLAENGSWNNALSNGVGNLAGLGMGWLTTQLTSQVMGLFDGWKVDQNTTAEELMAQQYAKEMAVKVQSELLGRMHSVIPGGGTTSGSLSGLGQKIQEYFTGVESNATLGAARDGVADDKGNTLSAGTAPTVQVEGMPIGVALALDVVVPAAKPITEGSSSVLTLRGSTMVAREGSATAAPSKLVGCSSTVFVGGLTSNAPPLTPKTTLDPKTALALSMVLYADGEGGVGGDGELGGEARPGTFGLAPGAQGPVKAITPDDVGRPLFEPKGWVLAQLMDSQYDDQYPDGYRAGLFVNPSTGESVFVPQGTNFNSLPDWFNNFAQGLGFVPPQYEQALADAQSLKQMYPNLTIVGHSLGGGLASYAGLGIGAPVINFNPAGLGPGTLSSLASAGVTSIAPGQVQTYVVDGEILTGFSTFFGQSAPFGDIYVLPFKESDSNGVLEKIWNSLVWDKFENHQTGVIYDQLKLNPPVFSGSQPLPVPPQWSPYS